MYNSQRRLNSGSKLKVKVKAASPPRKADMTGLMTIKPKRSNSKLDPEFTNIAFTSTGETL